MDIPIPALIGLVLIAIVAGLFVYMGAQRFRRRRDAQDGMMGGTEGPFGDGGGGGGGE